MENITLNNVMVLDVISVIVIVAFVMVNYFRGFSKTVISVIGYILAIVLGSFAGDMSASNIYDSFLKENIISDVETVIHDNDVITSISDKIKTVTYGINISTNKLDALLSSPDSMYNAINTNGNEFLSKDDINNLLSEVIDETMSKPLKAVIPSSAIDYMINLIKSNENVLYGLTSALTKDSRTCAEYIEETFVSPIVIYIIKIAVFVVIFFITMIIAKIISTSIHDIDVFPGMSVSVDRFLGALTGLVEAIVVLLILAIFLKWIVSVNIGDSKIFESNAIQSTKLFKYIYNVDTLKLVTTLKE
ncbi:MAG: CvpA family protein [Oscillospiraceae bacterium]